MEASSFSPDPSRFAHKWWVCFTLFLGTLSVALSVTSLDVAIPSIMSSLGAPLTTVQWLLTGFMIARTVLIPSVGWLGDRMGDRNLFMLSTAVFTLGSFLCSVSWDAGSLIFFRIIQAVGAGPLIGVAMAIMYETFPRHERGLGMGLFMTGWSLGPFFGPLLGGYFTENVHWRAIFYINIPIGLLSIVSAYLILPPRHAQEQGTPMDWVGFISLTTTVTALLLALSQGQELGWSSRYILCFFGVSLIFLFVFVVAELKVESPFIEIRHFRSVNFSLSNGITFLRTFGFRGASFLVSLFLQRGLNYSPLQAGIFQLPAAIVTGTVSPIAGIVSDRLNPKVPMIAGFLILVITLYGLSTMTLWTSMGFIFFLLSLNSGGQSSLNAPLNTVALGALPEGKARMGSGIIGMSRGLGEAFGVATMSFLLERYSFFHLSTMAPLRGASLSLGEQVEVLSELRLLLIRAGQFGDSLEVKAQSLLSHTLLNEALTRAYHDLFLLIGSLYFLLAIAVLFLRTDEQHE